jgi:hypothetical protein
MMIIEGEANAVETKTLEEFGIGIREEIFKELQIHFQYVNYTKIWVGNAENLVEEEVRLFRTNHIGKFFADLEFTARIA